MPKTTTHGKFESRPDYDEAAALSASIADVRAFLEKELACIDGIETTTLQAIGMFAMIDCLAQEQANYPANSKVAFCQFVLKHQKQCDYLESIEPVTLYYHVEDLIEEKEIFPGEPPEKEVSLDDLGYLYSVKAEAVLAKGKAEEILAYIEKHQGAAFAEKKAKEHQFIALLYRMRSKAVHEMSGLGETWKDKRGSYPDVPFYRDVDRGYVLNGEWVSDDVIELVIPNAFIRKILVDCIDGYLAECEAEMRFPFSNNHMTRKHLLSWYDK